MNVTASIVLLLTLIAAKTDAGAVDYDAHVAALRERYPADTYTILIQRPFVVIGDEAPDVVRRRAEHTVGWAVTKLKAQYFDRDPDHVIDVWLLRDRESYERHLRDVFGREPTTPYGCYLPGERAMVMNIATGGGTLVHEIVHPFMEANFPACPAWFNEGLGSLYEQSSERDGAIVGLTNWRLAGLQRSIRDDVALPTFEQLCGRSDRWFYDDRAGTHYAMARYLCYDLQERGLLRTFYREYVAHHADDPTGYATLQRVLGEDDMVAFQRRWEQFVLSLTFP